MTGVLVTGGAAGIGWAIARAFAARGDRVAILDLDGDAAAARAAELGPDHLGLGGDVTDEASVAAAVDRAEAALGGLGVVVNNAGIGDDPAATLDQDLARFRRVLAVHLDGTFLVSRAAARHMLPRGRGAIVNIASIAAPRRAAAPQRLWRREGRHRRDDPVDGLRMGACRPPRQRRGARLRRDRARPRSSRREGGLDLAAIRRRIPLGALGAPEAIADAVVFLASDAARYVTGALLPVDGGWSAFGAAGDASQQA